MNKKYTSINTKFLKSSPVLIEEEIQDNEIKQFEGKNDKKDTIVGDLDIKINPKPNLPINTYKSLKEIGIKNNYPKFGKMLKKYYDFETPEHNLEMPKDDATFINKTMKDVIKLDKEKTQTDYTSFEDIFSFKKPIYSGQVSLSDLLRQN
jgi:hypothetical protein